MAQIWFRGNKAAQKFTEEEAEQILWDTWEYVQNNPEVKLTGEVDLFMLTQKGVSQQLRSEWINNIYKDNKSICDTWHAIHTTIENRMIYNDGKDIRPNIQALILTNRHRYAVKQEIDQKLQVVEMPTIKINGKDLKLDVGT